MTPFRAKIRRAGEQPPTFLELPGPRWVYASDQESGIDGLVQALKVWRL